MAFVDNDPRDLLRAPLVRPWRRKSAVLAEHGDKPPTGRLLPYVAYAAAAARVVDAPLLTQWLTGELVFGERDEALGDFAADRPVLA